jgi:hypothetical protein
MNHSAAGVIWRPRCTASVISAYASRKTTSFSPRRASSRSAPRPGPADLVPSGHGPRVPLELADAEQLGAQRLLVEARRELAAGDGERPPAAREAPASPLHRL